MQDPHPFCAAAALPLLVLLSAICSCSPSETSGGAKAPQLTLTEVFRIGDEAAGDTVLFSRLAGMAIDSEGRLFVGDVMAATVYVFSETGELVRSVGGKGAGPGEMTRVGAVLIGPGDTLYVQDRNAQRLSAFEPTQHVHTRTVTLERGDIDHARRTIAAFEGGFIVSYVSPYMPPGFGFPGTDIERFREVFAVTRDGKRVGDPILSVPEDETLVSTTASSVSLVYHPFARSSVIRPGPSETLYSAWSDAWEFTVTTFDGEALRSVRHPHDPVPVTRGDVEALLERRSGESRRMILGADLPETWPAYATFLVDDQRRIWIKHTTKLGAESVRWTVLDGDGAVAGEFTMTGSSLRLIRGRRAYGTGVASGGDNLLMAWDIDWPASEGIRSGPN